jgi:hypothetical protein
MSERAREILPLRVPPFAPLIAFRVAQDDIIGVFCVAWKIIHRRLSLYEKIARAHDLTSQKA